MKTYELLAPEPDAASKEFFEGCAKGELRLLRCQRCGLWSWPVASICNECNSFDLAWTVAAGRGAVYSWSIVHKAFTPRFADATPYIVALVDLIEGLRITTTIDDVPSGGLKAGLAVHAEFRRTNNVSVPVFVPDLRELGLAS